MARAIAAAFLWLLLIVPVIVAPVSAGAFDPPGLAADAGNYASAIRAKAPPQPNLPARDAALKQARAALVKRDVPKAIAAFEKAIFEGDNQPSTWLALSDAWTAGIPANPNRALHAAFLAYRADPTPEERGAALLRMATVLDELLDRGKEALDALEEMRSEGLDLPGGFQERLTALQRRVGLTLRSVRVAENDDPPRVCLEFSSPLSQEKRVRFEDFVRIEPAVPIAVEARDERLCLTGINHGQSYQITLRQGLPGPDGLVLQRDETQRVRIGDRKPSVAFRGRTFILPRGNTDGLPVTTVNLDAVAVSVYRVNDRNLAAQINERTILEPISGYHAERYAETDGEMVWKGRLDVKSAERNRSVITGLPIRQVLGDPKPGLYIITAEPVDVPDRENPYTRATQWLMVSDLGLTSMAGADGITVFARSFATAQPLAGIEVKLVARNNGELGRAVTDAIGRAIFPPGLARGNGGQSPVAAMAYGPDGDFAVQDLTATAFDLSDRGVGGRTPPGPLDVFLYTDRGVYRPGETINLAGLLRDDKTLAAEGFPLTLRVLRPSGTEFQSVTVPSAAGGGFTLPVTLSRTAPLGTWSVHAFADPKGEPLGRMTFQVEEFVPERLAVEIAAGVPLAGVPLIEPGKPFEAVVTSRFLYGPPAAGLNGKAELSLQPDPAPYPAHRGFRFGLAQETVTPRVVELTFPTTDEAGVSRVPVELPPLPDVTRPMRAEIRVAVAEPGGRPTRQTLTVPVRTQPYAIGIRPLFDGARLNEGQEAGFEVIAVDPTGNRIAKPGLRFELFAERQTFHWFLESGRYSFRSVTRDESLRAGTLAVAGGAPTSQDFGALSFGRYRLEVFDKTSGVATSIRFASGWQVAPQISETPDEVEVVADKPAYAAGEVARVRISPPFAGEVLLTVATDRVLDARNLSVPAGGATVEIPVDAAWGPGAYITATVHRPPVRGQDRAPVRAIGLAWLGIDPAARTLTVELGAPEVIRPRGRVEVPVRVVAAGPLEEAWLTLAAVDEGILQLTDFVSPNPGKHFYGKRALGLDIRDDYGHLIDTVAEVGTLRQGGDGSGGAALSVVPITVVSLFSGPVKIGADGTARVGFDIPDFNGQLRLMAVAYDRGRIGSASGKMVVRDPLVAEMSLPRFLAPGDESRVTLSLHNVEAPAGIYRVAVATTGPLAVDGGSFTARLDSGARFQTEVPLRGTAAGIGAVSVRVEGPQGGPAVLALERRLNIQVRPSRPVETVYNTRRLEPGVAADTSAALLAGYLPGTGGVTVSYSSAPPFNVGGLLRALDRYPYGCLEQVVSRALPLMVVNDVALALGADRAADDNLGARVDKAVAQVLDKQRYDGSFGLWSARSETSPWLTAYALEFLTRARARNHAVPETPYTTGLTWLRRHAIDGGSNPADLASRAYALHVLALAGVATPGPTRYFHDGFLDKLPTPLARAQVGAALARLGDRERARLAFNAATAKLARQEWQDDYGSTVRDAAALVTLMSETGMLGTAQLAALVDRMPATDTAVDRTSTQEQAWLVLAAETLMKGAAPIQLTVGGKAAPAGDPLNLAPGAADLARGVTVRNAGTTAVWQAVSVQGVPLQARPAAHEGMRIKRKFMNRDGSAVNLDTIRQNDVFVVVLEGEANTKLHHQTMIVHPLPAGWEIENVKLGAAGTSDMAWLGELTTATMIEARDDRFVAALDFTEDSPTFRLAFLVRAVTPGNYELPGAQVEDMYKPRFFARQTAGRISVLPATP